MPNTVPPIANPEDVRCYRGEIEEATSGMSFQPLMTFKLLNATPADSVAALARSGAVAGKLYPQGVTTHSEDGVTDLKAIYPVLEAMQGEGLVLSIHGEKPNAFCLDREIQFLEQLDGVVNDFPKLKISLEHITTAAAVEFILQAPGNVAATITVHHLRLTLDDVIGDSIQPHHFCKPIPKRPTDLRALQRAATGGSPKFFLGTDSAPHRIDQKECASGCAGVFSAPVMMAALSETFDQLDALGQMEDFTSRFGAEFYGLSLNSGRLELVNESWLVPEKLGSFVPFCTGQELSWKAVGRVPLP